jgi:hypothetical protein
MVRNYEVKSTNLTKIKSVSKKFSNNSIQFFILVRMKNVVASYKYSTEKKQKN